MIKRSFIIVLLLFIYGYSFSDNNIKRPNVLLIISDDQGIGDFGFMGNKHVKTPNLDRLAEQSAVFPDFVVAPACSPTRSSLMTGRNHLKAGVWGVGARNNLMRDESLMPEFFKSAGYGTGYFGKQDGVNLLEMRAWNRGCDEASHVTGYVHKDATSITHKGPVKRVGWTCDVDVDNSLDYIKRQGDNPWWCSTAFILPHLPWEPDERFAKPYRDAGYSKLLSDFYGCVTQMDDAVGRLLKGLEDLGQADNTIVIFLSDNGPSYKNMSETDIESRNPLKLQGTKATVWENGIKVPLMVRWPEHIQPGKRSQFATVEDIVPTLIELVSMDKSKLPGHLPFDGISLQQALLNPGTKSIDRSVLRVAISFEGAAGGNRAIVNEPKEVTIAEQHLVLCGPQYKYHNFADGTTALYDIINDPGETKDVSSQFPEIKQQYEAELMQQYESIVSSGRAFRMPLVMIGENKSGYNNVSGLMAKRATPNFSAQNFNSLQGFASAGDTAEYEVKICNPGIFNVAVVGDNLDNGKGWRFEAKGKITSPVKTSDKALEFDPVSFNDPKLETFKLYVNKNSEGTELPLVKSIRFSPKKIIPDTGKRQTGDTPLGNDDPAQWDSFVSGGKKGNVFVSKDWAEANPVQITDMGKLDGFYRHTQLQGHLVQDGLNLHRVPDFWCTGSDFPYMKKESDKEVFFVDEFSVTRFLGGYPQRWKANGRQLKTNDMVYIDKNEKVQYRLNLVKDRLQQYIDNGYTHFIIGIENIWDLSSDPGASGPYGPTAPPRDWQEWYDFIRTICKEMARVYPAEIQKNLKFKIGNEYNQKKSFTGTHEDYLKLYDYSAAAIRSVFSTAEIMPGEIGGEASHPNNSVDYPKLFDHFITGKNYAGLAGRSPVSVLARSTHSFPHVNDLSPHGRVEFSVRSFKDVLKGKPYDFVKNLSLEYHQFGVIGSQLLAKGNFSGPRETSWHFQVMFRSKASGYLDKCWSWDKSERIQTGKNKETHLLNGIGWLYSVLDHLRGDNTYLLESKQPEDTDCDVTSVAFVNNDRVTLILSSWSKSPEANENIPVRISIPESVLPFKLKLQQAEIVSSVDEEKLYKEIKRDLGTENNLKPIFKENKSALGNIPTMAVQYAPACRMIFDNIEKYKKIQQESLTLKPIPEGKATVQRKPRQSQTEVSAVLLPDELCVLVFRR